MTDRPLQVVTIRLFRDDLRYLRLAYPVGGYNSIVRAIVARHVRALRNKTAENLSEIKLSDEELNVI